MEWQGLELSLQGSWARHQNSACNYHTTSLNRVILSRLGYDESSPRAYTSVLPNMHYLTLSIHYDKFRMLKTKSAKGKFFFYIESLQSQKFILTVIKKLEVSQRQAYLRFLSQRNIMKEPGNL